MENQDKNIEKYFRKLSEEKAPQAFPNMDEVWDKIEQKLDQKETKKVIPYWKYAGIAAALLVFVSVGIQFIKNNPQKEDLPAVNEQRMVIDEEKGKEILDEEKVSQKDIYAFEEVANKEETNSEQKKKEFLPKKEAVSNASKSVVTDIKYREVEAKSDHKVKEQQVTTQQDFNDASVVGRDNSRNEERSKLIKGVVKTQDGDPIPGATVMLAGTNLGTNTGIEGEYSFNANKGEKLQVHYEGYKPVTLTVSDSNVLNVTMVEDDSFALAEVVVDSYRTTSKNTANTAVSTVTSKTIEGRPNASFIQTLQGQVPGLNIATGSGQPGATSTVVLRGMGSINGNTEPLYVVDGTPVSARKVRKLNPNDIKSISVLKDSSATAIYGNRGANGVIKIDTQQTDQSKKRKSRKQRKKEALQIQEALKTIHPIEVDSESYESYQENLFESSHTNPVSTFSIDVDNAAYTNIRRFINNGQKVPKDAVRVEEMINFFKYDYPKPTDSHPFSINTEYSDSPWNPNHKLLKIGLQGKEIPSNQLLKSNFVFLVDVSGSMDDVNKLPLLKESMKVLLNELRSDDRVSIVYYASGVGVLLEPTKASEKSKIINAIDNMRAGGGTSGAAGLDLAYEMAAKHFIKDGNNRIILATDGDFNIGKSSDKEMQELIEEKRKSGVFLTCLGFGMGNYKDSKMITLSKKGNGNYAYIDNIQEANRFLGKEFKGSMYAIAKDVKIQIEFNPAHVQAYRLIGYEMRKLRNEDFTNDAIDAGELGSGHTVTALYEVIPTGVKSEFYQQPTELKYTEKKVAGTYQNELATVKFRYKNPKEDKSIETIQTIENKSTDLKNASSDFKFASSVAWFGLKLRDSKLITDKESKHIIELAKQGIHNDKQGYKAEFIRLVESVK
ncbi:YfbK domain-containing protein [Paenimyroides aestuarii]|uniref:von Willebrand factor type A domain-containing protein n=1 Tax=Paenimyroides aestuarii TaxID=2968490 RepID=A0ABY5NTF8_9FLAO|nr:von Willebrand factor type A domain-containing protein [Paenimyroides aestuarii]UUV21754.1 von Willebrand factor type A domain-containing protein [Paenimyroides aestuarii]